MRKLITLGIIGLLMMLTLFGCSKSTPSETASLEQDSVSLEKDFSEIEQTNIGLDEHELDELNNLNFEEL